MRFDFLATPIAGDKPTGPDLEEEGEAAYFNYILPAQSGLPTRYIDQDGNPFDRTKVNVAQESLVIRGFLERSYDIRLLLLEARFQVLNGTFGGFADCLEGLALLLETFWEQAHPDASDLEARAIALSTLEGQVSFVVPLQYAPIVASNRHVQVTYRRYLVATDKAQARETEERVSVAQIGDALRAKENHEALLAVHADLLRALDALRRIHAVYWDRAGAGLKLEVLPEALRQIAQLIASHVEGLTPEAELADEKVTAVAAGAAADHAPLAPAHDASSPIQSRNDATQALACIEAYYMACEPSALALVLIHQARMLEGRPLVEAIEALVPDRAGTARLKLGPEGTFELDMVRLKYVTDDALSGILQSDEREAPNPQIFATSRAEAAKLMALVEGYYEAVEPASPIPMLLSRARNSVSRDFTTILKELLPRSESQ